MPTLADASPKCLDLSLVLACYDEAVVLENSVRRIVRTLEATPWKWEIIFVDDVSRDDTRAILRKLLDERKDERLRVIFHERNTGRGGAVSDGFRAARGEVVGFIDVDLEVGPETIVPCVQAIRDGADVAMGKRIFKFSLRGMWRYTLSTGYARLARTLLPLGKVTDSESGYKFFRRETALALLDRVRDLGWFWDTEIMCQAVARNCRISEVPCLYVRNHQKRSTVRGVRDSLVYLGRLSTFRRRLRAEARIRDTNAFWREHGQSFADHYTPRMGLSRFVGRFLQRRADLLEQWITLPPGQRALDAGCGHGLHLAKLAKQGARITGLDISPAMLARARLALDQAGCADAELLCADVNSREFQSETFDLVLAIGMLDYLPDWNRVLLRLASWTRIGGRIVFTVPKRPSPFWFLRSGPGLALRRGLFNLPPILVAATRAELERATRDAGLRIEEVVVCQATMWAVKASKP
jgi:glycosyltransferase involved in cell wall biosynthesis